MVGRARCRCRIASWHTGLRAPPPLWGEGLPPPPLWGRGGRGGGVTQGERVSPLSPRPGVSPPASQAVTGSPPRSTHSQPAPSLPPIGGAWDRRIARTCQAPRWSGMYDRFSDLECLPTHPPHSLAPPKPTPNQHQPISNQNQHLPTQPQTQPPHSSSHHHPHQHHHISPRSAHLQARSG